jgi:hypothetical protein
MVILQGNIFYFYYTGGDLKKPLKSIGEKLKKKKKKRVKRKVRRMKMLKKESMPTTQELDTPPIAKEKVVLDPEPMPEDEYDFKDGSSIIAQKNKKKPNIIMDPMFDHVILGKDLVNNENIKMKLDKKDAFGNEALKGGGFSKEGYGGPRNLE